MMQPYGKFYSLLNFIYLFYFYQCWVTVAVWAFSSCSEPMLLCLAMCQLLVRASFVVEHGLLAAWASVVAANGLSSCGSRSLEHRLNSGGTPTLLLQGMWNLLESGIKPMSPALEGRFFTTEPPGKPS